MTTICADGEMCLNSPVPPLIFSSMNADRFHMRCQYEKVSTYILWILVVIYAVVELVDPVFPLPIPIPLVLFDPGCFWIDSWSLRYKWSGILTLHCHLSGRQQYPGKHRISDRFRLVTTITPTGLVPSSFSCLWLIGPATSPLLPRLGTWHVNWL